MSTLHRRLSAADPLRTLPPRLHEDPVRRQATLDRVLAGMDREATPGGVPAGRRWRPALTRRLALTLATAATAVAAVAAVVVGSTGGTAYAVERRSDGSIVIRISEYRDPKGLERKLKGFGVNAVIDYLPFGTRCREPRAEYTPASPDLLTWADPRSDEVEALVLHPELIPPGHKLVYTAYLRGKGAERTSVGVPRLAKGPVRACERVPGGPTIAPDGGLRFEGPASPTN